MLLSKHNETREKIYYHLQDIVNQIFKVTIISYFLFLSIELIEPGFIISFFDLSIMVYIIIISGILTIVLKEELNEDTELKYHITDWIVIFLFGIGSIFLIYFQIRDLGNLSYYISALAGIIIMLISFFLFNNEEDK